MFMFSLKRNFESFIACQRTPPPIVYIAMHTWILKNKKKKIVKEAKQVVRNWSVEDSNRKTLLQDHWQVVNWFQKRLCGWMGGLTFRHQGAESRKHFTYSSRDSQLSWRTPASLLPFQTFPNFPQAEKRIAEKGSKPFNILFHSFLFTFSPWSVVNIFKKRVCYRCW